MSPTRRSSGQLTASEFVITHSSRFDSTFYQLLDITNKIGKKILTTAKLQLSSMTIVKRDIGYGIGAYYELGFHMLLICSIFVNVKRIIFMYLLAFLYNTKIRDHSNIIELP